MFQHQWRRRHRHGKIGRAPKPVATTATNLPEKFEPTPKKGTEPILLEQAEIEALKLAELEKLTFKEAAAKMKVSRNTVWRLAEKACKSHYRKQRNPHTTRMTNFVDLSASLTSYFKNF